MNCVKLYKLLRNCSECPSMNQCSNFQSIQKSIFDHVGRYRIVEISHLWLLSHTDWESVVICIICNRRICSQNSSLSPHIPTDSFHFWRFHQYSSTCHCNVCGDDMCGIVVSLAVREILGNFRSGKCLVGDRSIGELSVLGEVSVGEMSGRGIVLSGTCPSGNYPLGNCLSGICPRGSVRRASVQSGKCPRTPFSSCQEPINETIFV